MLQLSLPAKARLAVYSVFLLLASGAPSFCAPSLIAPQDTVYLSTVSPTFYWTNTTPNYQLQVDNNSDFSSPVIDIVTSSISYTAPAALLQGVTYYWHVKDSAWSGSYSFNIDTTAPTAVSYRSISSTGGVIGESQFNDLISGVTVQINIQDVLSGLAVTTAPYPAGGHSVMYSNDAGKNWFSESTFSTLDGAQENIYALAVYAGKLYAGQGNGAGDGDIHVLNGGVWYLNSYAGTRDTVSSFAVYDGKLYAGMGNDAGEGDVYAYDGSGWTQSFEGGAALEYVTALAVYNGRLYAGTGLSAGDGDIYVFDGTTWTKTYDGGASLEYITALAEYNGKLYAGAGLSSGDGDVYVFDGATWAKSYEGTQEYINALAVYNGKLYAGQGSGSGDGDVLAFDGKTWSMSYDGAKANVYSLAVYNAKLYAGLGSSTLGDGDVYVFDGNTWNLWYDGARYAIHSLAAYDNKIYAGQGNLSGDGDIISFAPVAVSSCTGADGSTEQETLAAVVDLKLSTNTEICGGAAPCGATNQLKFFATDLAGNVKAVGPYALLTYVPGPSAEEIVPSYSTGSWLNVSSVTFASDFQRASYYRYIWDNSPAHVWSLSETVWSSGGLGMEFGADAAWYLHVLPYNIFDSSGVPSDIGPFNIDRALPAISSYRHISSSGGAISESQLNDLLSGVTVQIDVQDALSGLAVTTAAFPAGGYGIMFSTDAGNSWVTGPVSLSYDGAQDAFYSMAVYNGKLYAGQGIGATDGDVYVFDGTTWSQSYNGLQEAINCLAVYNGKLYAGQGSNSGDGDVLVFDGANWNRSYDGTQESISSLAVYNGKLYAGQGTGTGDGDVLVFDGSGWTMSYNGVQESISSLAVYNGKLYAGQGTGTGDGDVLVFDGANWALSYDGAQEAINCLAVYNGKLYAGQGTGTGDGDVLVFDGANWALSYDGAQDVFYSMAVYSGKLYAGQGSSTLDGDIFVFNGDSWVGSFDGLQEYVAALAVYNGKLYAGQGIVAPDGDVYVFSPEGSPALTGADGSTGPETFSALLGLASSTNTETCGGVSPCGATNQVRFFSADLAGNVRTAGPYAVLTYQPNPSAAEVGSLSSTNAWTSASSITFTSGFREALYYRYAWDNSSTHVWDFSEPVWGGGALGLEVPVDGGWYLHVLPYNILASSGPQRDIGPYGFDREKPAISAFRHISSTGGIMAESQFNDLVSGVTVQMSIQDAISGLAVTTTTYPSGGHGVMYSIDAGRSWLTETMALSFDGPQERIKALAVYNGKLYAAQCNPDAEPVGDGDIYVYDGKTWTLSFYGGQEYINALAVYNGKLYAGQGGGSGDGDVYAFDGYNWTKSHDGLQESINSLAVHDGRLYAGQGFGAGDGDVLVFDGSTWAVSYNGAQEYILSLASYGGKLYAGQGNSPGDGDVLVFDGTAWSVSYNGAQEEIYSLGVYDGKLYAGQGYNDGDGDIYVYDGASWALSYDGAQKYINTFAVYNGRLYAGQGGLPGAGDVYMLDGDTWRLNYDGPHEYVNALAAHNGRLYAGVGFSYQDGDILSFSPVAVSSVTGADGSTGLETLSVALDLAASTNTQTCGGVSPCGATNQVKFVVTDMAGNPEIAGPYAVLTYTPNPSAAEVTATYSTGSWLNASSITFTSGFRDAAYYRYVWDNSAAHTWTLSETVWGPGPLGLEFSSDAAWYLHILPYNILDSSGPSRDIGPFTVDRVLPSASSYRHISSSGGIMAESQFNDLLSGVTVQMDYQDVLSGLAVTTAAYPSGGHGLMYSRDAGKTWLSENAGMSYDGAQWEILSLAVYDGKLYAGQGGDAGAGDVLVYDGNAWSVSYDGAHPSVNSLAVYDGKLYAGMGNSAGDGDIYVFAGRDWILSYDGAQGAIYALAAYNGKLYAGQGGDAGDGDVLAFDGKAWALSLDGAQYEILSLAVYNGKLYAGQGVSAGAGDIYVFDGGAWSLNYDGAGMGVSALAVYDGKLYAGHTASGACYVYVYDGNAWVLSFTGPGYGIFSLAVYNGKLYAGQGSNPGDGEIYAFDGETWSLTYDGPQQAIEALAAYNGKLYAGLGYTSGDIVAFSPLAVTSATAADGFTGAATLSAGLELNPSTNTQTCGGVSPCGATNQVKFFGSDLAGNVKMAGPYAILASAADPSAAEVSAAYSTGAWINASSITFASGFKEAAYYRYVWDNTAAYEWNFSEAIWPYGAQGLQFASDGVWYLHVLPYNISGSSGAPRDIGPFNVDRAVPSLSGYAHISSTGGAITEGQANYISSGVTVQMDVRDILGGLAVTTAAYPYGGHSVEYSTDAGKSWAAETMAVSFDGAAANIFSLAVYEGELYTGQGGGAGDGDVYVFDGTAWSLSYDGAKEIIGSLAVYNGKLYAGQGISTGDGDVYVFDGSAWALSYDGAQDTVSALAVYNGKLYAAGYWWGGDGDLYVFDGDTWTLDHDWGTGSIFALAVYNGKLFAGLSGGSAAVLAFDGSNWSVSYDAVSTEIYSLAAYNGKLYAGRGNAAGLGDIYVFDGNTWALSYNGAQEVVNSLAVYNGKLYAGQGYSSGDGDVFIFDGGTWTLRVNGAQERIYALAAYGGKLYAGQGSSLGDGDVLSFAPAAVSSITGADGSTGMEVLSATLNLAKSTNTEICGGATPCGATNQVRFIAGDLAGNVVTAGPYAVLSVPVPSASEVRAVELSTGNWQNVSSAAFVSGFKEAAYYRYAWDNSPAYAWAFTETLWKSTGTLWLEFGGPGSWYLHVLPYNILDSSGTPSDIGPFNVDWNPPSDYFYRHVNSTGGIMDESQFNDLVSGVTVQMDVDDGLSGLAVTTAAYPSGAHSVLYSVDAGQNWLGLTSRTSYDGGASGIYALAAHNGKLYAGEGSANSNGYSKILVYDGESWAVSASFGGYRIGAFAEYNGELYAAQNNFSTSTDGDVFVMKGDNNWVKSFRGSQEGIYSLAVYNGKLYAGQGTDAGDGDVYVFDGSTWSVSYNGAQEYIYSLAVHNGKLYAGQGSGSGDGDILVFDGSAWSVSFNGAQEYISALAVYNGKLYAGQGSGSGDGDILVLDGGTWFAAYNGGEEQIFSLAAYNGILYAGQGSGVGDGDLLYFDGTAWTKAYEEPLHTAIRSLGVYNGRLYAGQGNSNYLGDILEFSPVAVTSMTGTDGTTGQETMSVMLDLVSSSNTETCGGVEPCGATNQVKFIAADMAGNIEFDGPYAVLVYSPNPSAAEVAAQYSTGPWLSVSSISFVSGFKEASYYRYAWDNSISHAWNFSEPAWNTGILDMEFAADGSWYLHVLPYNILDSSGPSRDIGPFNRDLSSPEFSSYRHISSTGGLMAESQFNDLPSGVTVQIGLQDALSGLVVTTASAYGFRYSTDAGATWNPESAGWSLNYNGGQAAVHALAVYDGRLYSGHGKDYGDGDIYVFDGKNWTQSFDSAWTSILSLAAYDGKLYAGRAGLGLSSEIYAFDGNTWSLAFAGTAYTVNSLAVYDGRLYAGLGGSSGQGDIYVFDGNTWALSYDGYQETISALTVYNGKLYAGQAGGAGDGDIFAFNGNYWTLSYDGAQEAISALAAYNGKLYAGQGTGTGDGDIFVFDGAAWNTSFDGTNAAVESLAVYYDKLYAGQGSSNGLSEIYAFDGNIWEKIFSGEWESISALAVYNNELYAGQRSLNYSGTGDIFKLRSYAAAVLGGADGSTGQETLSAMFTPAASTNTQTCSGAEPCGATNQLRFFGTDIAGNVRYSGPYALISAATPDSEDVLPNLSTGAWHNTSTFSFSSGFRGAAYYRYAWDTSASYAWSFTEPQWLASGGILSFQAAAEGADHYLHILPYNVTDSSGTDRHIGPFRFETASPSIVPPFSSVSSTGGLMGEGQFNDLSAGVTVQIGLQDLVSGLEVSTYGVYAQGFEAGGLSAGWRTGGDASWYVQSLEKETGLYAARSGPILNDQATWLEISVPNFQGGAVKFSVKRDFTYLGGFLYFYIDGAEKDSWSGKFPWTEAAYDIPAGSHTLKWEYRTASSPLSGENAVWLDGVSFHTENLWAERSVNAGRSWERAAGVSLTGPPGSTGQETFSAVADLAASTNTETCGGSGPCGATNQVKFYAADRAGNVVSAGPYAVISVPEPDAGDIIPARSTGVWYNGDMFAFVSDFQNAEYYRYTWDNSASHVWSYTEPQWLPSSGTILLQVESPGADQYLHVLPYNLQDSSGPGRDIGPFRFEASPPSVVSGFSSVSSTGGSLSEGQFNDLLSGVTVQLKIRDLLAGLMVTDTALPAESASAPGGFAVRYSTDSGRTWCAERMELSLRRASYGFSSLAVYNGKLYAGYGDDDEEGDGDIYAFDGTSWVKSFDGDEVSIRAMAVYDGKLYAGQYGYDEGDGAVYVFDGATWSLSFYGGVGAGTMSLAVYNGKLYAGQGWDSAHVYVFDGRTWRLSIEFPHGAVSALAVYSGKLYAGIGDTAGEGDIYVFDGNTWQLIFDGARSYIPALAVYNGKLYAGQAGNSIGDGNVYVYDGNSWSLSFAGPVSAVRSLAVHKGQLYAGLGDYYDEGEADIYAFDGASWRLVHDSLYVGVKALQAYDGGLYAAEYSWESGSARVLKFTQPAAAVMTGENGSAGEETLSAVLDLQPSASTETCGGAAPCGATNQVMFSATDLAGNVMTAGPYAVIAAPPPDAGEIVPVRSTGSWYNGGTYIFSSAFQTAAYYRYAWDTSASHAWSYTEPQWLASVAAIGLEAASQGSDYYLHALPYDKFQSSGPPRHIGPFRFETAAPAVSDFSSVSSTGGFLSESQANDLASGVTVRLKVQDLLSGLAVSPESPHGEAQVPAGGYAVRYSTDAGITWLSESVSTMFAGRTYTTGAMAVYNGKLYVGQGDDDEDGEGDVYVFDGTSWALSFNGYRVAIRSLAVYDGKLYAGQYGWNYGDGQIYVFDGLSWDLSYYDTFSGAVNALAAYNGKLYAALYGWNPGDGDIYEFDGKTWRLSFDGAVESFSSFAVHGGKLYAGQGYDGADGDAAVYVFDGNSWQYSFSSGETAIMALASYNGRVYAASDYGVYDFDGKDWRLVFPQPVDWGIPSLAVHNGLLYAGLNYWGDDGEGDIYAFDGLSWRRSYDGNEAGVRSMAVYNGALYAGQYTWEAGGDVVRFSPLAVSTMTGTDGTTGQEVISAALNLAASTNTETCSGTAPCGATNQVMFSVTDRAGNVTSTGPYAVITAPPLSADDVVPARSTGVWFNSSTFTFTSNFVAAAYYRYVWDINPSYAWAYTEPLWQPSSHTLSAQALAGGATWYLHVLPYSVTDSYGAGRDIGPFLFDAAEPLAGSFRTFNSTGVALSEGMWNNLAAGVTAQLIVQDILSGLSTAYYDAAALGLSAAGRGFEDGGLGTQWETGGDAPWAVQGSTVHSGHYAARAGNIDNDEHTYLQFTADVSADGEISFYLRASCEQRYDFLRFKIDNEEQGSWAGDLPIWIKASFPVKAGRHVFRWEYTKDLWDSELSDSAWVDDIEYPGSINPTVQYSTTAGNNWTAIQSSSPAASPYIALTGAAGSISTQTFAVYGLDAVESSNAGVCDGSAPCAATNQVKFLVPDLAGNIKVAGPYSVLVDTTPTAAINDLSTAAVYYSSITLTWTAPEDTGAGVGAVTTGWYRIDYATYPGYGFSPSVYKAQFSTQAVIGELQSLSVEGLCPYSTYYFAVYAGDRVGNVSGLSNIAVAAGRQTLDCGVRMYDGGEAVPLSCEFPPAADSRLKIYNHGKVYGIILLDTDSPCEISRMRVYTNNGLKAVKKY